MELRFHYDADTGLPHISNHGVTEEEVEQVLRLPGDVAVQDARTRIKMGQTVNGRYLKVVYSPDEDGIGIFVITAYDMSESSKRAYRRRKRKRGP